MNHLGRALTEYTDPPVDVLFVYNCNPVATVPDQRRIVRGLEREDLFTVVFEQVMTDTALYADVVLPDTTFLEGYDFAKAYGPIHMGLARPIVDVVGESRSNADVFGDLASRLELLEPGEPTGELDLLVKVLDGLPGTMGADLSADVPPTAPCGPAPVQFVDVFPNTRDRKVDLFPAEYESSAPMGLYAFQPDPATDQYPLALISPASERTISSTLGQLPRPDVKLLMHPADAEARGLADGDLVQDLQRAGRGALPAAGGARHPPGHDQPAERSLAPQHAQRRRPARRSSPMRSPTSRAARASTTRASRSRRCRPPDRVHSHVPSETSG